jgi:hypothetical protein
MTERKLRLARTIAIFAFGFAVMIGMLVAHYQHKSAAPPVFVRGSGASNDLANDRPAAAPRHALAARAVHEFPGRPPLQPAPLPPPDSPLAQTYHELKTRADAGDAAAAERLYADVNHCFEARGQLQTLPLQASALGYVPASLGADQIAAREKRLAGIEQELRTAERDATRCKGLSDEQLQLPPVALAAALLGVRAASDCYVSGALLFTDGILDHPEWLSQYRDNALSIADNALAAGDWNMVDELQRAYAPPVGFHLGPLSDLIHEDTAMGYRLLRLQRLGTQSGPAAESLDRQLAAAAENLSADSISAGDAWAQDTFTKYFSGGQRSDSRNLGCD